MTERIALILGAGPNIGQSVAKAFKDKGYRVAVTSRSADPKASSSEDLSIQADLSHPEAAGEVFEKVKSTWGVPHVVIYNAYVHTDNDPKDALEVPVDTFTRSTFVNLISAYAAAREAVQAWKSMSKYDTNLTFIYTGNCGNTIPLAPLLDLSVGKAGSANFVAIASEAYKENDNFRFYYADQRNDDGTPMWDGPSGEGHAQLYLDLAESDERRHWLQTFVAGQGYKRFEA
ncbi:NAD(P)-binding protein [Sarocladium strictum]